jgi:hypothetical protein
MPFLLRGFDQRGPLKTILHEFAVEIAVIHRQKPQEQQRYCEDFCRRDAAIYAAKACA